MSRSPSDRLGTGELPAGCEPGALESEPTAVELADGFLAASHSFMLFSKRCIGDQKLSLPRVKVLLALAARRIRMGDHVRMHDLAEELGVTPRNITTIVDGLEREGLLARRPDPSDRRAIWLELTPLGLSLIEQVHQLEQDISVRFFEPLNAEQRRQLATILTALGARDRFPMRDWCDPLDEGAAGHSAAPRRRLRGRDRRLADQQLDR
jgi:DNA-binding MarR family transcriptional regulator